MNILLTGDDGYNSIGIRLLIHYLHKEHKLTVVGTKTQQSAVGGKLHVKDGCAYTQTKLDNIDAYVVDGAPADAMEFANVWFKEKRFDLIISGMNLGENISSGMISSGTVSAAVRAYGLELAPKAIAISWYTPGDFYFKKHDETESLAGYLDHPGESLKKTIELCIKHNLWDAKILNINLPKKPASEIRFTHINLNINDSYPPPHIQKDQQRFAYPFEMLPRATTDLSLDSAAIEAGYISITPINPDWTEYDLYEKMKNDVLNC